MSCDNYLPARYDWPAAVAGDTFPGLGSLTIRVNGEAPASSLSGVAINFSGMPLTSANGRVVIDDAENWSFHVPEFQITGLQPGTHSYDLVTTSAAGQIRTYLEGTWKLV